MVGRSLFGRSRELAELDAALQEAIAGRGSVFLLCGEPGIGKTRLAQELAERAQRQGAWVHWGRAWEVEGAPPCWPWAQVLRSCWQLPKAQDLLRASGAVASDLSGLVPELELGPRSGGPAELDRFRLHTAEGNPLFLDAAARLLASRGAAAPTPSTLAQLGHRLEGRPRRE